jgi:hypothetical protein
MGYSSRIVRDRAGFVAAIKSIQCHPAPLLDGERKLLKRLLRDANSTQPVIISTETNTWLISIARKRRVEWPVAAKGR